MLNLKYLEKKGGWVGGGYFCSVAEAEDKTEGIPMESLIQM